MKIFIDIGHPAHVHYFKNFIHEMRSKGHHFFITSRDKEMSHYLLKKENISFVNRGKGYNSVIGKIYYMFKADLFILKNALRFRPDIFIGFASFYTAQVSSILRKPSIVLDDTENGKFQQLCYRPFADYILSPTTFSKSFGKKHLKFNSYLELSYLHPNYFEPNFEKLKDLNLKEGEKFIICRFVSWNANHDFGHTGISIANKIKAVKEFSKFGKVFISSETELPDQLKKYKIKLSPENIHHALYYSSLLYGESATMASECAVLGTPSIYIDNEGRGYTDEQEVKYKLVYNFNESNDDQIRSIKKGIEILESKDSEAIYSCRRSDLLSDKIDFTNFLTSFIENFNNDIKN